MQDRPLLREKVAQICKIDSDIYSFSFSAVELLSTKVQRNQGFLCYFRLSRDVGYMVGR